MYGNGCAGSTASGVSTGKMRSSNTRRELDLGLGVELVPGGERDAGVLQRGRDLLGERGGLARHQLLDAGADRAELLDLVEAVGRRRAHADRELFFEPGDADLEELVDVAAEDREELGPFEQRDRRDLRRARGRRAWNSSIDSSRLR